MNDFPASDFSDDQPFAVGLTDRDIQQLLAVIRARTDREILSIHSTHEEAEVVTGQLRADAVGDGEVLACVRAGSEWHISHARQWRLEGIIYPGTPAPKSPAPSPRPQQPSPRETFPKFDPLCLLPYATGLTDCDIGQLLKLIRTKTSREILSICSERHHASVVTGFMAGGDAGDGEDFKCVRIGQAWEITESGQWIA